MNTETQQAAAAYTAQLDNLRRQIELAEQAFTSFECTEDSAGPGGVHPLFFELRRYTTALIEHLGRWEFKRGPQANPVDDDD